MTEDKTPLSQLRAVQRFRQSEKGKEYYKQLRNRLYHDPNSRVREHVVNYDQFKRDRSGYCETCGTWAKNLKRKSHPSICSTCYNKQYQARQRQQKSKTP